MAVKSGIEHYSYIQEERNPTKLIFDNPLSNAPVTFWMLHCNKNPIYVFLLWEFRSLSPNFHIRLFCERFVLIYSQDRSTYFLQQNRQIDCGNIYISLTDTWMWKLGLWPSNSFSGNICFEFSVLVLSSVAYTVLYGQPVSTETVMLCNQQLPICQII